LSSTARLDSSRDCTMSPNGDLRHFYGAKTTPHMFAINPQGQLVYDGAIDDKPTSEQSDIAGRPTTLLPHLWSRWRASQWR
jgi:hypothetical protein